MHLKSYLNSIVEIYARTSKLFWQKRGQQALSEILISNKVS